MADDPTMPTPSGIGDKGQSKRAFDTARETSQAPQKPPNDPPAKHEPKPVLTYEMKGPDGNAVRQQVFAEKQAAVDKSSKSRDDKTQKIIDELNSRKQSQEKVNSKEKDDRSR